MRCGELASQSLVVTARGKRPGKANSRTVAKWLEFIRPDFVQSNISIIAGAKKLIEAKAALKGCKGEKFSALVNALGMDLGKAERLMVIARHPVLSDSAHAPILPFSWMTLYTLAKIPPEILFQFLVDGLVHPHLKRKEAERLVERARGQNAPNGSSRSSTRNMTRAMNLRRMKLGDAVVDKLAGTSLDSAIEMDELIMLNRGAPEGELTDIVKKLVADAVAGKDVSAVAESAAGVAPQDREDDAPIPVTSNNIGADSKGEIERRLARADEVEREARCWEIQRVGYESEVAELKAKLDETPVRHQRRLFRQVLEAMQKADSADIPDKEKRALHTGIIVDLTEFVRSAKRDGLSLNRFDIYCRPEMH